MPEEIAARVTRNMCEALRTHECLVWVARWRVDHPESIAARTYDPRTIEHMENLEGLKPQAIARVEQMFRGLPPLDRRQSSPLARAGAVTHLFSSTYVHAIPFDRAVLRNVWNECASGGDTGAACHTQRLRANAQLDHFAMARR